MDKLQTKLQEVLQRDPIECSMLMRTPMRDPMWDAQMFVGLTMSQDKQTPPDLIPYVRHEIEATCAADSRDDELKFESYMKGLDEIWPALEAKMRASYGLAEYMRTLACHSLFLPRYYAELYHPMSMDAPYGFARRIDGKYMRIPQSDVSYLLCAREPIFGSTRMRTAAHQLVQEELGEGILNVSLGAAMLPEQIRFGWQERGIKQRVIAYDNAPGVLECVQQVYAEKPLSEYGIDYRVDNFWNAFKDPDLIGKADLVGMEGGLSYYRDRSDDLFDGIAGLLRSGGHFCGEVELKNIYTIRCGVLGWKMEQEMQFDDDAESAIKRMEEVAAKAGLKMVEAISDTRSVQPAMVWFHLQKP